MGNDGIETTGRPSSLTIPAAAIVFCVVLAFAGSLGGAFVFDDESNILQNPFVRVPCFSLLRDPAYTAALNTRPLANVSMAVNYAIGGFNPFSYHLVNLGIHATAALLLFFSLVLLFRSPGFSTSFGTRAASLSFLITLLWAVHPLQTESVTYVVQRCESLMGMFFLAAVYFALKGWTSPNRHPWHLLSVLCFFAGAATKEVMAACPFVIFVIDVAANQKKPMQALKESWVLYAGFVAGLVAFAWWIVSAGNPLAQGRSRNYTRFQYLSTQPDVILHYLRLCFWPDRLNLDYYGWPVSSFFTAAWTSALAVAAMVLTAIAVWRKRPIGIAGAWFFLILFPSSGMVPLNSMAAEHRMYLPLAAVVAVIVCLAYRLLTSISLRLPEARRGLPYMLGAAACLLCATALGMRTGLRNQDYASESGMWQKVVDDFPGQARARVNLCSALRKEGKLDSALSQCGEALRLKPGFATALVNIGAIEAGRGQYENALKNFLAAIQSDPMDAMAVNNVGAALLYLNRPLEAAKFFQKALEIKPYYDVAASNLAFAHLSAGEDGKAGETAGKAILLNPKSQRALTVLGVLAAKKGDDSNARSFLERALSLDPTDVTAKRYLEYIRSRAGAGG